MKNSKLIERVRQSVREWVVRPVVPDIRWVRTYDMMEWKEWFGEAQWIDVLIAMSEEEFQRVSAGQAALTDLPILRLKPMKQLDYNESLYQTEALAKKQTPLFLPNSEWVIVNGACISRREWEQPD